jgi:hypothetical protein
LTDGYGGTVTEGLSICLPVSLRTVERCQQSEQQARDSPASQWQNFPAGDKRNCIAETSIGGFRSYVQVPVCLELARDARTMKVD